VLDAGTGTGFAAVAAARAVGPLGQVLAVDVSAGMLAIARRQVSDPEMASITWRQANAVALRDVPSASVDVVIAAAALLYMPVAEALTEWNRLLKPGGTVGFSSMRAGSPLAGKIFREAAATVGVHLADPSAPLGSGTACAAALRDAGFVRTAVTTMTVIFSAQDISLAWVSNLAPPAHAPVGTIGPDALARMNSIFESSMARAEQRAPGATTAADVILATSVRRAERQGGRRFNRAGP
jgi:SAM-dependent methyltransferase